MGNLTPQTIVVVSWVPVVMNTFKTMYTLLTSYKCLCIIDRMAARIMSQITANKTFMVFTPCLLHYLLLRPCTLHLNSQNYTL